MARLVVAWPTLPEDVRASIVKTVKLATVNDVNVYDKSTGGGKNGNIVDGDNSHDAEGGKTL